MVEVHLEWLEPASAVGARHSPDVPEELDHPVLPDANALELEVAVPLVVLDVVRTLAGSRAHAQL